MYHWPAQIDILCPGIYWHITHRSHKREFLLKFSKDKEDRRRIRCLGSWTAWLLVARFDWRGSLRKQQCCCWLIL